MKNALREQLQNNIDIIEKLEQQKQAILINIDREDYWQYEAGLGGIAKVESQIDEFSALISYQKQLIKLYEIHAKLNVRL